MKRKLVEEELSINEFPYKKVNKLKTNDHKVKRIKVKKNDIYDKKRKAY